MARPKSELTVGDKVEHISTKYTGVVVFKQDQNPNDPKLSVHFYKAPIRSGLFKPHELKKCPAICEIPKEVLDATPEE